MIAHMEEDTLSFDEIRPYHDHEVNEVLMRLTKKPSFFKLMKYMFPEESGESIVENFKHIHTTLSFQEKYISRAIRKMVRDSSSGLTYEGLEKLDPEKPYLFISNHRDIIMDSAILNVLLFEHGYNTTEIAIGDNLMVSSLVTDLMKLNKSFIVHRKVPMHDMLAYSTRLSKYIRTTLTDKQSSVWLAQRNGRAKDGDDKTQASLLKMLNISGQRSLAENYGELNIIPMAVSYEIEPCGALKAEEWVHEHLGITYEKDDKTGMIRGIRDPKGRIHLHIGEPISPSLKDIPKDQKKNEWIQSLANLIDDQIFSLYKLWPGNYIASDVLSGTTEFADHYSQEEKEAFDQMLQKQVQAAKGDPDLLRMRLLSIYAKPVWNRYKINSPG